MKEDDVNYRVLGLIDNDVIEYATKAIRRNTDFCVNHYTYQYFQKKGKKKEKEKKEVKKKEKKKPMLTEQKLSITYHQKYEKQNKEHIGEMKKGWYAEQRLKRKICSHCECDVSVYNWKNHCKTKKHLSKVNI
jgi:hypothetical protein